MKLVIIKMKKAKKRKIKKNNYLIF